MTKLELSATASIRLLIALRLRRAWNRFGRFRAYPKSHAGLRSATPTKSSTRWLLGIVAVWSVIFQAFHWTQSSIVNLHCHFDTADGTCGNRLRTAHIALAEIMPSSQAMPFTPTVAHGLCLLLACLFLLGLLLPFTMEIRTNSDWDLEWLATLPMTRTTLLWGRLLERAVNNSIAWGLVGVSCATLVWFSGARWWSLLFAIGLTVPLLLLIAMIWMLLDTGLRISLPPARMRSVHALCVLFAAPTLYVALSLAVPEAWPLGVMVSAALPSWVTWTPPGLVIQVINTHVSGAALMPYLQLLLETAILLTLGMGLLRFQVRRGIVAVGGRESGRSRAEITPRGGMLRPSATWSWLTPVQARELKLLWRDRTFFTQVLLSPLLFGGMQFALNGKLFLLQSGNPTVLATAAFGIGAYVLLVSALSTVIREGEALWMLYTYPHSQATTLREKALLWAGIAVPYALAMFVAGSFYMHGLSAQSLGLLALALLGLPIYAMIAVALAVLAGPPLPAPGSTRVASTYVALFGMLVLFYGFTLVAGSWPQKVIFLVLSLGLAGALWQKALDHLPYLLDQYAAPASRVSLADGMIAVVMLFIGQVALLLWMDGTLKAASVEHTAIAYAVSGTATFAVFRYLYWRSKTRAIPVFLGASKYGASLWGVGLGLACGFLGITYLNLLHRYGAAHIAPAGKLLTPTDSAWLLLLTVGAAPLCEEFIFRGLIFGGLRRSLDVYRAAACSAALFAAVHPLLSIAPVFVLGLCTALLYERKKQLLAPILVHATYNAIVIGYQLHVYMRVG